MSNCSVIWSTAALLRQEKALAERQLLHVDRHGEVEATRHEQGLEHCNHAPCQFRPCKSLGARRRRARRSAVKVNVGIRKRYRSEPCRRANA
jgi:hypothetical protein